MDQGPIILGIIQIHNIKTVLLPENSQSNISHVNKRELFFLK